MNLDRSDRWQLEQGGQLLWELFHENSKMSRYERHPTFPVHPSDAAVVSVMDQLRRVKPYRDRAKRALPDSAPQPLAEMLRRRTTARSFGGDAVALEQVAAVLSLSYGVTRDNVDTAYTRPFRIVPSGGALYPLELYLYATRVNGLPVGLYHYDAEEHSLDILRAEDDLDRICGFMVQKDLVASAAAIVFISGIFFRSTFKYGDRGYRFVLIEAGHVAQNANLVAAGCGMAAASIGGYSDRDADRYLGFDGLSESTVYVLLLGSPRLGDATELPAEADL